MRDKDFIALEHKFSRIDTVETVENTVKIEGYASIFGQCDNGGDVVQRGAYRTSLAALKAKGRSVKMLWQHDPSQPIGVWDAVYEDARGLYVKGRILPELQRGREAMALIEAGAIDGLSIGYRTVKARKDAKGHRLLTELELWEVSLVTFPMLPDARLSPEAKTDALHEIAAALRAARATLAADP